MKLFEYQGVDLFEKYGIAVPVRSVVSSVSQTRALKPPVVVKAQVLSGDRKKLGGIIVATTKPALAGGVSRLLKKIIAGEKVSTVLVVEKLNIAEEYYLSFSYDTQTRCPVFSCSPRGGSGVAKAHTTPLDMAEGVSPFILRDALASAKFPSEDLLGVGDVAFRLWKCFIAEYALLAEINPLIKTKQGAFIAADAKVILDDEKVNPGERRFIEMDGDIAILASGGGASLLNIDTLLRAGGRPANYTEYSGNPPREVVAELTKRVLSRKGLKGCWVVGGTANFTDIFETLSGFIDGLRLITPKPSYPIVIRRDGPRQEEAWEMLKEIGAREGYDFHLYGRETDMAESARIMARLIKKQKK
ncbi:MAG: ATP-grasp domain-containing protein [Candidatus Spechtbacterales bacterium]